MRACWSAASRRRNATKVVGRFLSDNEEPALTLLWAVLREQHSGWRGVKMEPDWLALIRQALMAIPKSMLAIKDKSGARSG